MDYSASGKLAHARPEMENSLAREMPERIEILSVELLDHNRPIVEELKRLASSLHLEFGWHYLLDLSWTIQNLKPLPGMKVLDAGAGTGIMQWYLAQAGVQVTSVDRMERAALPLRFRNRFNVQGLQAGDLLPTWRTLLDPARRPERGSLLRRWGGQAVAIWRDLRSYISPSKAAGSVVIYNQDLSQLVDIPDNTFDAIVSISALEHNTPDGLVKVVAELMRVLKPGGLLLATMVAARDEDWWHPASSGWCFSDTTLRRMFDLPSEAPSNYAWYDELFTALVVCCELSDNLADFYSQSDDNGMPRGVWKPEYQPVGILKVK